LLITILSCPRHLCSFSTCVAFVMTAQASDQELTISKSYCPYAAIHQDAKTLVAEGDSSESESDSSSSSTGSSSDDSSDTTITSSGSRGSGSSRGREVNGSMQKDGSPRRSKMNDSKEADVHTVQRCTYAAQVQSWTDRIPIGLGLCPWAGKSRSQGRLRYVTCEGNDPSCVAQMVLAEAEILNCADAVSLSSTLIVCPHVAAWKDFQIFDAWVTTGFKTESECIGFDEKITLVSFHPDFLRWRGLPEGVEVGTIVQSYWGTAGRKSFETSPATIIETQSCVFGMQKVKVRFDDGSEQYVPIDWFAKSVNGLGAPLPDNAMHRAPHPTVHLIRNKDLAALCMRDVSRVKRRNAQRMMNLGWEGVAKRLSDKSQKVDDAKLRDDIGEPYSKYST